MRLVLKLIFFAAAITVLCWLAPRIAESINRATAAGSTPDASRAYALFSIYLITAAALAVFVAWEISQFFGWQAARLFLGGGRINSFTPAVWKAERLCRDQKPLEAIGVLREYLAAHPRHWRIAVWIAEIYQRDLKDPLPAALEYEQLLKRRLPRTARAWIMVRLAACHLLLRDLDQSAGLLRNVIKEFPRTPAAETAARRLARLSGS
jgi:hypothetical protein